MKLKKAYVLRFLCALVAFCTAVALLSGCYITDSADWARRTIQQNYYRFDGDYSSLENLEGLTIEEMVQKLDIYSAYYTREQYAAVYAENAGSKSGIGISYSYVEGKGVVLYSVVGNSPAKKVGLKAGDVIVSASAGGESVQFTDKDAFTDFAKARVTGEEFTLNLEDGRSVTLAKTEYTASYASMYLNDCSYEIEYYDGTYKVQPYPGGIPQLPEGTAYMYLSQFYGNAANEIGELIAVFNDRGCNSLILDLRDNGGGYVDVMAKIGGLFTTKSLDSAAVAMVAKYKSGKEYTEYCPYYKDEINEKMLLPAGTSVYVMANVNTASASEALVGVLVSYNILKYENIFLSEYKDLEARSYGKGIMQSTFENRTTGEVLKLTVAGIYWANGQTIHGKGLTATHLSDDPAAPDKCSVAPASDTIVNVGYDDELKPVIDKIIADRTPQN